MIMHKRAAIREIERQTKAKEFCAQFGLDSEIDAITCGKIWTATGAK